MAEILIVEDERAQREALAGYLRKTGYRVTTAASGTEALEGNSVPDVVLLDLRLPDIHGLDLLKKLREKHPDAEIIVITAYGTVRTAVEAMKLGAFDYLTKPVDLDELLLIIGRALEKHERDLEVSFLKEEVEKFRPQTGLIGESAAIKEVLSMIYRVAPSGATVLITGESGTGKELAARTLHAASPRKNRRFVAVSCAAIPESLLESELFGYERGAFTGATRSKPGKFALADGGTLFLDEIGDLPTSLQVKLLRVLQEKEVERLGSTLPRKVDVRIIAATNQDLRKKVEEGSFREDLFYRINTINIHIPPLRERKEDILPLAEFFLRKFSKEMGKDIKGFDREARKALLSYQWPGNVRELINVVERAVVLTRKNIITADLLALEPLKSPFPTLEELEREHIKRALDLAGGNLTRASELLGIHRNTLREKLKKYNLR